MTEQTERSLAALISFRLFRYFRLFRILFLTWPNAQLNAISPAGVGREAVRSLAGPDLRFRLF
jgi:hypothetical protein